MDNGKSLGTLYESGKSDYVSDAFTSRTDRLSNHMIYTISDTTLEVWRYQLQVKSNVTRKLDNGTCRLRERRQRYTIDDGGVQRPGRLD